MLKRLPSWLRPRNVPWLTVLLATVCPGLLAMKGPHGRWVGLAALVFSVIWVVRWTWRGFLFGILFLWLSLFAVGLSSLGPGQVDNMLPGLFVVFGWLLALIWLGPASLFVLAASRGPRVRKEPVALQTDAPAVVAPPKAHRSFWPAVGVLAACVATIAIFRLCWIYRPRHPQQVAIDAVKEAGARVELSPGRFFGPVLRVRGGFGNTASDREMKYLAEFEHLTELDLDSAQVSDAGLEHLRGLKNIRKLYLSRTQISGAGLAHLEGMTDLQELRLEETAVSDAGLEHLRVLKNIRKLYLRRTQISGAGLAHLEGMPELHELRLDGTAVSDSGLAHLARLSNLVTLAL